MPGLMNPEISLPGSNVRITVCATQGGRKYMEDRVHIHAERLPDGGIDYMFFGCYDGHGGAQASEYTRENLMDNIVSNELFRSHRDADVLEAIRLGFLETHFDMLKVVGTWPRTASGYQSTAGTTASIAFVMNGKLYTGHVGDSAIVLGTRSDDGAEINAERLTIDHKPDSPEELRRIERHGGQVLNKAGVMRVVWRRTVRGHEGPIRRSTPQECIPFLAVARSLGDLWSYNADTDEFVVSPEPDTHVHVLTPDDVCIVLASDGLWNVIRDQYSISIVDAHEWRELDEKQIEPPHLNRCVHANHSRWLVRHALRSWGYMRADNITAITVIFDPPTSTLPSASYCVVDEDGFTCEQLDQVLTDHPDCMIRITPHVTQRLRTAPVDLVYNGAMDVMPQPNNGSSFDASQRVCIGFEGPGFSHHRGTATPTTQRSVSTVNSIIESVKQKVTANKAKSSPSPTLEKEPTSKSRLPSLTANNDESSEVEDLPAADSDMIKPDPPLELSIVEELSITVERTTSANSVLHNSPQMTDCPTDVGVSDPSHSQSTSSNDQKTTPNQKSESKSSQKKPRFVCRKHGFECAKVKLMNSRTSPSKHNDSEKRPVPLEVDEHDSHLSTEQSVPSTSDVRKTETPPPPDPKPSAQVTTESLCLSLKTPPTTFKCDVKPEPATSVRKTRQRGTRRALCHESMSMDDTALQCSRYNLRRASKQPNIAELTATPSGCTQSSAIIDRQMCRSAPAKNQVHSHYLRSSDNQPDPGCQSEKSSSRRSLSVNRKRRYTAQQQRRRSKEFAENIESFHHDLLGGETVVWKRKSDRQSSGTGSIRPQSANEVRDETNERWCPCEKGTECSCVRISSQYDSVFARLNLHSTTCTQLTSVSRQLTTVSSDSAGRVQTKSHYSKAVTSAAFPRAPRVNRTNAAELSPVQPGTKRKLFDVDAARVRTSGGEDRKMQQPAAKRSRLWNFFGLFGNPSADRKAK